MRLPRADADALLGRALGIERARLYAFPERTVTEHRARRLDAWIERRCNGEPVAYIVGSREFWGLELEVTPDVMIPRPDTETLVEAALDMIEGGDRVLDLGTGSGAVALAIKSQRPDADVTASDIDPECLALARRNAAALGLDIDTVEADGLDAVGGFRETSAPGSAASESDGGERQRTAPASARFDAIVTNPPYVEPGDPHLDCGDLRFEPRLALVGGIRVIERIVRDAPRCLSPGGGLALEHGFDQGQAVARAFEEAGFRDIRRFRDLAGNDRVTTGRTTAAS